jgi:glycine cleavage system transcriptional repressor
MKKFIISVVGLDRPGLVAALSGALFSLDCNVENISQTLLQSVFGAILIVGGPAGLSEDALESELALRVAPLSLDVTVKPFPKEALPDGGTESDPFIITTMGPDRMGLVAATTQVMAEYGVNITNLQAVFKGGGDPFNNMMIYEVMIPKALSLPDLSRALKGVTADLGLEINIQHRNIFEAMNRI